MKMKIGDLEVEVIDRYLYCRHCSETTPFQKCRRRGHRSGVLFLLKASVQEKSMYFSVGEGEFRFVPWNIDFGKCLHVGMSGASDYEYAHQTMSGWYSLKKPAPASPSEIPEPQLPYEGEEKLLMQLLNEYRKDIVVLLTEKELLTPEVYLGVWEDLKGLVVRYHQEGRFLTPDAEIQWLPKSWVAVFKFGNWEIRVPKARPNIIHWKVGVTEILVGKKRILFGVVNDRKILYVSGRRELYYGYEEWEGKSHSAILDFSKISGTDEVLLFTQRLGDVLFKEEGGNLEPAEARRLQKIQVYPETAKQNGVIMGPALLFHPDHGWLTLPKGTYRPYVVPVITPSHE
jgi:hypothetical protein